MNADCTYQIGHDHTVCEDYALAGALGDKLTYAIVCDGCSASPDVDFGARALALAARETLQYKLHVEAGLFENMNPEINPVRFGDITINKAGTVLSTFRQLHPQALDATLLVAWVQDGYLDAYIYGDGVLVHRTKDRTNAVHIHLTSGAPDYLSYGLDKMRLASYNKLPDNKKEIETRLGGEVLKVEGTPLTPYALRVAVEPGDVISVISDGIGSFRKSNSEAIPWNELVDEFTSYKNFVGQFVQRRINAFKRKCVKDGTTHLDDISVASIYV
jgi:hypothetical protein